MFFVNRSLGIDSNHGMWSAKTFRCRVLGVEMEPATYGRACEAVANKDIQVGIAFGKSHEENVSECLWRGVMLFVFVCVSFFVAKAKLQRQLLQMRFTSVQVSTNQPPTHPKYHPDSKCLVTNCMLKKARRFPISYISWGIVSSLASRLTWGATGRSR